MALPGMELRPSSPQTVTLVTELSRVNKNVEERRKRKEVRNRRKGRKTKVEKRNYERRYFRAGNERDEEDKHR
jgi:hypothetical protein